jgi:DDE superfamily endonuclease
MALSRICLIREFCIRLCPTIRFTAFYRNRPHILLNLAGNARSARRGPETVVGEAAMAPEQTACKAVLRNQSTWYSDTLPSYWVIGVSENGWVENELGLTWLEHVFENHTAHRTKGVYRLLILDRHGSHLTPEFDLFCKEHSSITLCIGKARI